MFDLDSAVQNWRTQIEANRAVDCAALDELEDHVREEYAALVRAGKSKTDAWSAAITRLGDAAMLVANLQKVRVQPLLWIHIATITLGYSAGLFAATFAGYGTLRSFFAHTPVPALTGVTLRMVRFASVATVALTVIGFVLGALVAEEMWGRLFTMDPREFGAIFVVASFIATLLATLRSAVPTRVALALAITAGATVLAAWFGTAAHRSNYPPLLTAVTVASLAITLGLAALSLRGRNDVAIR
jgi:hypothetical protein